jgi:hypothetical protein
MLSWRPPQRPLLLGFILGLVFGCVNLIVTWVGLDSCSAGGLRADGAVGAGADRC